MKNCVAGRLLVSENAVENPIGHHDQALLKIYLQYTMLVFRKSLNRVGQKSTFGFYATLLLSSYLLVVGGCADQQPTAEKRATYGKELDNPYTQGSIEAVVASIIANQLSIDLRQFNLDKKIVEELGADDLDVIEIVIEIETVFEAQIDDEVFVDSKSDTKGSLSEILDPIANRPGLCGRDFVDPIKQVRYR